VNSAEIQVNRCQVEGEHVITAVGLSPGPQPARLDAPVGDQADQQQVCDATQPAAVALHANAHAHIDPVLADGWSELQYVQIAVEG